MDSVDIGWRILVNLACRYRTAANDRRKWKHSEWYSRRYAHEFYEYQEIIKDAKKIYAKAIKEQSNAAIPLMIYLANRYRKAHNALFSVNSEHKDREELFDRYLDNWNAYAASKRIYHGVEE